MEEKMEPAPETDRFEHDATIMNPPVRSICVLLFWAPGLLSAAESAISVAALPSRIYALAENREGGNPGTVYFYNLPRSPIAPTAIFSTMDGAKTFIAALPETQARKVTPFALQRDFLISAVKANGMFVLDPPDANEGGRTIVAETSAGGGMADNDELRRLFQEDQSDRTPRPGDSINWSVVGPRDQARRARAHELYLASQLRTGADFFRAAMIFQHGQQPEDYLLSHELSIVAACKCESAGKWLAASSEDRFLMAIGRKQRFGTQLTNPIQVDGTVTDALRAELNVPTVAEAEQQRAVLNPGKPAAPTSGIGGAN